MIPELITSLLISAIVFFVSIALIIKGKKLRDSKSSGGISASSNETSTGTSFIVCGLLLFITQIINVAKLFA